MQDVIRVLAALRQSYPHILHPASHTHRQLTDEQLLEAGVAPDLTRLSIGLEDPEDIIEDLKQALD